MQNNELYPGNRHLMGILNTLCCCITHMLNLIITPVIIYIAKDFGIDNATAGSAATLHVMAQGIFILISPIMIGWIDNKKTQLIGCTVMIGGALLGFFAPSFGILRLARIISGAGHGICSGCSNAVIAAWLPPKEKSIFITANNLAVAGIATIAYTCTVPLYNLFGQSWRALLLMMAIILAVLNTVWFIFYKDNNVLNEYIAKENAAAGKKTNAFSGMKEALSRREVWIYWMFMGAMTIGTNGITTYLPQFLQSVRGFSDAASSSILGVASAVSAGATLIGGVVTTFFGKRKPIIVLSMICGISFLTASLLMGSPLSICALYILYTLATNFRGPAMGTFTTELKGVTPALTSSTAAVSFGIGFIGTSLTSPMLKASTNLIGEEYSMLVFIPLMVIGFIFALMLPETGPGRAKKTA